jgi:hypothetical protein
VRLLQLTVWDGNRELALSVSVIVMVPETASSAQPKDRKSRNCPLGDSSSHAGLENVWLFLEGSVRFTDMEV